MGPIHHDARLAPDKLAGRDDERIVLAIAC